MAPRRDNAKAAAARALKAEQAVVKAAAEKKAKEDASWADAGTKLQRQKDERKAQSETKSEEQRKRKEEKTLLEAAELQSISKQCMKGVGKVGKPGKLTQFQLMQQQLKKINEEKEMSSSQMSRVVSAGDVISLTPNPNHQRRAEALDAILAGKEAALEASTVDEALEQFEAVSDKRPDLFPEKRMKAAYKEYETTMLDRVKTEFPGLKRSQYIDKIFKMWQKAPENPMCTHLR